MRILVPSTLAALFAWLPLAALAQSTTALFIQRATDQGGFGSPSQVTIGTLPAGWLAPVPLPVNTPVLGTISSAAVRSLTVFYRPANAREAYDAYVQRLKAAGFTPGPLSVATSGFAAVGTGVPRLTQLCHGTQGVTIIVPSNSSDDLRVSVPQSPPFNLCSTSRAAFGQIVTPLPSFIAPPGSTLSTTSGGGASTGFTRFGSPITSVSSAVLISGKLSIASALQSFVSQLRSAGWQITDQAASRDAAVAAFKIERSRLHWRGSLAIYRAAQPHTYAARVDATGGTLSLAAVGAPPAIPRLATHLTKSNAPALVQLATRLAGEGGVATLYVAQLPPQMGKDVPLPNSKPIGSAFVEPSYGGTSRYNIYYTLSNAQLQSYFSRLEAAGWNREPLPGIGAVGFQPYAMGTAADFCRQGKMLGVAAQASTGAVNLAIYASPEKDCNNQLMSMMLNPAIQRSPLPKLTAPAGVTMRTAMPGVPNGTSGAVFITSLTLTQLLDSFTPQLAAAGWTAGGSSVGDSVGTRSFSITDSAKQHWQAVLTIYRSTAQANRYYAFIDLTNVSNDGTGV